VNDCIARTLATNSSKDAEDALVERCLRAFLRQLNAELDPIIHRLDALERQVSAQKMVRQFAEAGERR
jgi:hypothetical protein